MSKNFYDLYFQLKDMEINNVNTVDSTDVNLQAIDSIDIGVRQQPEEEIEPLTYTYDPEKGYVPNRQPLPGEPGFAPQGRIDH